MIRICRTRCFDFCCFVTVVVVIAGCGGEQSEEKTGDKQVSALQTDLNQETKSISASQPSTESSPANVASSLPPADASPTTVCQKFVEFLQSGDRLSAENLLTRSALAVTSRADLELEPLGGPQAQYETGEPMYATTKQKLAQVRCTVIDRIDGQSVESVLTWMVRKQKEGWRISGITIPLEDGQPEDLLSFESYADVLKIKSALADEPVVTDRQAEATSDSKLK